MYTALGLKKAVRRGEARVTVIDPRSAMTYQPFLPEAAAGSLEPRHVVVPLRQTLGARRRRHRPRHRDRPRPPRRHRSSRARASAYELPYDELVVALGSISRTLPIPGLAENAMAFKQIEEAIALHNHALDRLDAAAAIDDPAARAKALTFVFVGGGYAGVEALGETEDMLRSATRYYPDVSADELRFVLVEAADRILPEVGEEMGRYTVERLRRARHRGPAQHPARSRPSTSTSCSATATEFDADTIVWTAGVKANPVLADSDLPLDDKGRIKTRTDLRVEGLDGVWAAGDNAAVPDLTHPGELTSPSAQHAVRQAKVLAANITRVAARQGAQGVPAQARRLGRQPRPAQGRRPGVRRQAARLPGLVHAPDLPHDPDADLQQEGARRPRLDAGAVLPPRRRLARWICTTRTTTSSGPTSRPRSAARTAERPELSRPAPRRGGADWSSGHACSRRHSCHLGADGSAHWTTTTAPSTSTPPSNCAGSSDSPNTMRSQRDRRRPARGSTRSPRPTARPGPARRRTARSRRPADQRHRRPARSSRSARSRAAGPPCGTDASR